jgi:prepilin-type N-terminal cleavage/methylation domain-containing protein
MIKNFKKKKNNKGFTLVELLVVIAIIGILAVVAVPALFKNIDKAKSVQVVTNVNAIKTEIMAKYADGKTYDEIADGTTPAADGTTPAAGTVEKEILDIVELSEIKADESYDLESTDNGVNIVVSTDETSNVLISAAEKFGINTGVTTTFTVQVIK